MASVVSLSGSSFGSGVGLKTDVAFSVFSVVAGAYSPWPKAPFAKTSAPQQNKINRAFRVSFTNAEEDVTAR